ncbi:MAG TPA: adenosine deaminase [Vicinamibacteria bacterium]|nr:adenosine deaminase [Vicinamibacteria bacterium]
MRRWPKVELHNHLDAGVRVSTVAAIGRELGLALPDPLEPALVAPEVCADLADLLSRIDLALEVMQRPRDLARIAEELVEDLAADGVVYGEVRFAPQLHTRRGLDPRTVVETVSHALRRAGERHGVETGLILCCLRHETREESRAVAELAAANRDRVCALDLAGDEGGFPSAAPHRDAFAIAKEAGLRRTVHAGENGGPACVAEALDLLGAERIGHGVRVVEDAALVERVVADGVPLEMCPRSNVQTRAAASLAAHPIDGLLRRGARVTVSTDGRTTCGTTVTAEFESLARQFGWGRREFLACQGHAARAAFLDDHGRDRLLRRLEV